MRGRFTDAAGFKFNDDEPTRLSYQHRFSGYAGRGGGDFDVNLTVEWRFGSNAVTRTVSFDAAPVTRLEATTDYTDLTTAPADIDQIVAAIVTALLDRIDESSHS